MIIHQDTIALAFKGFQTKFTDAFVATRNIPNGLPVLG
jgi:hypothetical protein